ncbi:MAG: QueT transporter family protein [Bacilli bacterium]|nr:QueT transporter family protein [Bacilli bacterium]
MKKRFTIEMIARQAIVAALYAVLTVINPLSYGNIQFRIAEILVFLCFYRHDYIIGLTLGCFIANLFSPMLVWDITLGVGATVIALFLITRTKNIYLAAVWPIIANALLVALELYLVYDLPYWLSALEVGIGEAAVMVVGVIIFKILETNKKVMYFISLDSKYESAKTEKKEEVIDTEVVDEGNNTASNQEEKL